MKKIFLLLLVFSLILCTIGILWIGMPGVFKAKFTLLDNGNIVAPDGTEYVHLANEGLVTTFGSHTLLGKVKGEVPWFIHKSSRMITGMYSCEGDPELNVLMRIVPFNEWYVYYRKASLPPIDLSLDNCVRFGIVGRNPPGIEHMSCGEGIVGDDVKAFLADVRSQLTPEEAGLRDLVKELGIGAARGYGYLANGPNLAIPFLVMFYDDLAYSISFADERDYVLPEKWLHMLMAEE